MVWEPHLYRLSGKGAITKWGIIKVSYGKTKTQERD